jgi:hypothetical protein
MQHRYRFWLFAQIIRVADRIVVIHAVLNELAARSAQMFGSPALILLQFGNSDARRIHGRAGGVHGTQGSPVFVKRRCGAIRGLFVASFAQGRSSERIAGTWC